MSRRVVPHPGNIRSILSPPDIIQIIMPPHGAGDEEALAPDAHVAFVGREIYHVYVNTRILAMHSPILEAIVSTGASLTRTLSGMGLLGKDHIDDPTMSTPRQVAVFNMYYFLNRMRAIHGTSDSALRALFDMHMSAWHLAQRQGGRPHYTLPLTLTSLRALSLDFHVLARVRLVCAQLGNLPLGLELCEAIKLLAMYTGDAFPPTPDASWEAAVQHVYFERVATLVGAYQDYNGLMLGACWGQQILFRFASKMPMWAWTLFLQYCECRNIHVPDDFAEFVVHVINRRPAAMAAAAMAAAAEIKMEEEAEEERQNVVKKEEEED